METPGYNLVKVYHPSNSKCGAVYVYYKSLHPFKVTNIKYFQQSISFELRIGGKCFKFRCTYVSLSHFLKEHGTDFR